VKHDDLVAHAVSVLAPGHDGELNCEARNGRKRPAVDS